VAGSNVGTGERVGVAGMVGVATVMVDVSKIYGLDVDVATTMIVTIVAVTSVLTSSVALKFGSETKFRPAAAARITTAIKNSVRQPKTRLGAKGEGLRRTPQEGQTTPWSS
jgi:hypothetical protein